MAKRKTIRHWVIVLEYCKCGSPAKLIGPYKTVADAQWVVRCCNWSNIASVVPIDVPQRKEKSR